jgi:hypothetical protein
MTPHFVDAPRVAHWLDLDHVLAISEFTSNTGDPQGYSPRAEFSVTLAFQDKPLVFDVHDKSFFEGMSPNSYIATYRYEFASQEDINNLRAAYDKLLRTWKMKT